MGITYVLQDGFRSSAQIYFLTKITWNYFSL